MTAPTRSAAWREAHLVLLLAIIGGRLGVHLPELYGTLRDYPHWADRDDGALRELLDELGVPVKQVRVGDRGGRHGVHRDDVARRLTGVPVPPPPVGSALLYVYIPGQRGVAHRVERRRRPGEWST